MLTTRRVVIHRQSGEVCAPIRYYHTKHYRNHCISQAGLSDQAQWLADRDIQLMIELVRYKQSRKHLLSTVLYADLTDSQHVEYVMTWG